MTTMTDALKSAGVKTPPLRSRLWRYLKDNGPKTVDVLASEFSLEVSNIAVTLYSMRQAGLVSSQRLAHKTGRPGVYTALGDTYEDALAGAVRTPIRVTDIKPLPPKPVTGLAALPEPLQHMTIAQLRTVHTTLSSLFG